MKQSVTTKPPPVDHRPASTIRTRPGHGAGVRIGDHIVVRGRAHRIDRLTPYEGALKTLVPAGTRVAESRGGAVNGGATFRLAPDQPVVIVAEFDRGDRSR